ncbi:MAG: Gfo/Idh/MocA family protein [Sedimentitalea sp.]
MKRVVVAGAGLIGKRHVQTVLEHPNCELVGVVEPNPSIQTDVTRFDSMSDVKTPVDGVIIATPTHLHAAHTVEAAQRGWHVLIEKPVAGTLSDARAVQTHLAGTNIRSLVGHHRRYHACVQQLKSLIADGSLGKVVTVSLIWAMNKPDSYFDGNWRTAGGSPVMINLVHDIDLLRFVIGDITQTAALRGAALRGNERIESGAVAVMFDNGATGTIAFADTTPTPWGFEAATGENPNIPATHQDMLWITTTKGAISFPSMTVWSGTDWTAPATPIPFDKAENTRTPLEAQLDHFVEVMDGAQPLIDVADATRTLAIAEDIETQLAAQAAPRKAAYA